MAKSTRSTKANKGLNYEFFKGKQDNLDKGLEVKLVESLLPNSTWYFYFAKKDGGKLCARRG